MAVAGGLSGSGHRAVLPAVHLESRQEKRARERRAKAICAICPVRLECLQYALRINEQHGVWGGLNEQERRALLRERDRELGAVR